jgi:hypothetical protein
MPSNFTPTPALPYQGGGRKNLQPFGKIILGHNTIYLHHILSHGCKSIKNHPLPPRPNCGGDFPGLILPGLCGII